MKEQRDFMQYLADKLDAIDSRLDDATQILAVQQEQLRQHMRRSELNEEAVEVLKNELKPLQEDWLRVRFLGKLASVVAGVVSVAYYIYSIVKGH
jgi:chromosome segregation ATPase